jgi:hypothetical protein
LLAKPFDLASGCIKIHDSIRVQDRIIWGIYYPHLNAGRLKTPVKPPKISPKPPLGLILVTFIHKADHPGEPDILQWW